MPHHVLSKDEVHANMQRREHARDFIQIRMQTEGYEPSDTEVLEHLNLWNWSDAPMYDRVDEKVAYTS